MQRSIQERKNSKKHSGARQFDVHLQETSEEIHLTVVSNRQNTTQDLRRMRRYRQRWKIERLFAWLHNFRRLFVRYEQYTENFLGMLYLGCCLILLRHSRDGL